MVKRSWLSLWTYPPLYLLKRVHSEDLIVILISFNAGIMFLGLCHWTQLGPGGGEDLQWFCHLLDTLMVSDRNRLWIFCNKKELYGGHLRADVCIADGSGEVCSLSLPYRTSPWPGTTAIIHLRVDRSNTCISHSSPAQKMGLKLKQGNFKKQIKKFISIMQNDGDVPLMSGCEKRCHSFP